MAEADDELKFPNKGTTFDSTIGHSGIVNKITITPNNVWSDSSRSKVSFNQNSELETINGSPTEVSTTSIHLSQVSSPQIGLSQITPTQVGGIQISIPDNSALQPSAFQGNTKQVGSSQIGSSQISLSQVRSTQVDISQNSPFEVNRTVGWDTLGLDQLNPSEVPLSRIISNQQLLSSNFPNHNLTSNAFSNLKYSAANIWSDLLNSETLLDITFQITDLPTGQLAEAQNTSFDALGMPNAGTILTDDDANGKGWFINSTPLDNRPFAS